MAVLSIEDIKVLIKKGKPEWIKEACEDHKKLNVHINGDDVAEYLESVNNYENARQYDLRKKFATSNKFVFENLLRPIDKIFSAKGGNKTVSASTKSKEQLLKDKISEIQYGYSVTDWIQKIQANKFYSDPNGLVFFEVKDNETYPTIKGIKCIFNYLANGRYCEWVIFKPEKRNDISGKQIDADFYRVVDDKFDYLVKVKADSFTIVDEETYPLMFKRCPAIINSDLIDAELEMKKSPVDGVIELADHYLNTSSVKNIYEFLHGYPIFWAYVKPCRKCDGTGLYEGETCISCRGEGNTFRKDVSDVIKLKPPTSNEEPTLAPNIAGYVQPDLEVWREQRTELDWIWGLMHFTLWGTTVQDSPNGKEKTATEAFINVQPVNDKLNSIADSFEDLEKKMVMFIGQFYLGDAFKGASINYGRRFLVESPDQIWNKYEKAKTSGSPKVSLDYLLNQFYQAEFANDLESLTVATKGIKLEPFVHKTDEEISKLTEISTEDKLRKYYFNEWFKSLVYEDILLKDVTTLSTEFETYLKIKNDARQEALRVQSDRVGLTEEKSDSSQTTN